MTELAVGVRRGAADARRFDLLDLYVLELFTAIHSALAEARKTERFARYILGMRKSTTYPLILGMLSTALAFATWSEHRPTDSLIRPLEQVPTVLDKWTTVDRQQLTASVARVLNASSYLSRTYSDGSTTVNLFIAYYAFQRAGETMHSPKHCLPGAGWDIAGYGTAELNLRDGVVDINKFLIQKGSEHEQALYWYQTKNRIVANEYRAKALLVWDGLTEGRTSGSIVRIISADQPNTSRKAEEFAKLVIPEVRRCFGE